MQELEVNAGLVQGMHLHAAAWPALDMAAQQPPPPPPMHLVGGPLRPSSLLGQPQPSRTNSKDPYWPRLASLSMRSLQSAC